MRIILLALLFSFAESQVVINYQTRPPTATSGVTFDAITTASRLSSDTATFTHTFGGSATYAIVNVATEPIFDFGGWEVTIGGVSATLIGGNSDLSQTVAMFYLASPGTGAKTVSFTAHGDIGSLVYVACMSFNGAHSNSGFSANVNGDNAPTVDITSATGSIVVDNLVWDATTTTATATGTQKYNSIVATTGFAGQIKSGTGTVTMNWTLSGSANWTLCAVSVDP